MSAPSPGSAAPASGSLTRTSGPAAPASGPAALSAETRQPGTVRTNRVVLAGLGLLLFGAGVLALLAAFGVFGERVRSNNVLDPSIERFVEASPWFWPVVAVASAIIALLCLWWLLIQARSNRVSTIRVTQDRTAGSTSLDAAAVTGAVEGEISGYRGVRRTHCHLSGTPDRYSATVRVVLDGRVDAGEVHDQVIGEALPKLRQALSLAELACRLEFELPKATTREIR